MNVRDIRDFLEAMQPTRQMTGGIKSPRDFGEVVREVESLPMNEPLVKLFEHAGLDLRLPNDWYVLMGLFAEFLFDPPMKPGARAKWERPNARWLKRDLEACLAENRRSNGERLCEIMKERFPRRYDSKLPAKTILRWIGEERISIKTLRRKSKASSEAKKI
ncbi:hypothetical protein E3H11_10540 [Bradyrhizobium brasilense]|uniref:hypothetical protein n=1 Tax=Bradyrhizobium brasilense TaxID=1419277 RepID=UPI0014577169|nr:hypothetical protein [Bradyrhizobium brasilense]NLS69349.1 hypothetical protein [Bradyrhizobium brasilense]